MTRSTSYSKDAWLSGTRVRLALAGVFGLFAALAAGQELPLVSSLSGPEVAQLVLVDGEALTLAAGELPDEGRIELKADARLMLYMPEGRAAAIVLGPAVLEVRAAQTPTMLALLEGRMAVAGAGAEGEAGCAFALSHSADGEPVAMGKVGAGWLLLAGDGAVFDLAYLGQGAAQPVTIGRSTVPLENGQRVTIVEGVARSAALDPWRSEQGFDAGWLAQQTGVAAAKVECAHLEDRLFQNVIAWDVYGQSESVIARLAVQQIRPEVRTVTVAVTGQVQSVAQPTGGTQPPVIYGANEVPPFSPAAISVGGVTALELNRNAASLLTATGSQGLGTGGLSRLAVPGFTPQGYRTPGPAGLGAQR